MSIIYIGADHRGFHLKEKIKDWLSEMEYTVRDVGNSTYDKEDDFVDFAIDLANKTVFEKYLGILICGTGTGMCIAANKVVGARAAMCLNEKQARCSREHNNANILCISADLVDIGENQKIIKTFLDTIFSSEERHIRRIQKIKMYETENR